MAIISRVSFASLALALAFSTSAQAQEAAQPAAPGEIIVTAQKRSERLQSVPVSIQAVEATTLKKMAIASPKEFGLISPTLNFQAADEARLFNFSIRGIGTETFSVGVEPSVSTIVDGVVYTRVGSVFDGLNDLERVEVLNGPQGTLQGKNASAGAVVIVTKGPDRKKLNGKIEMTAAQNNEFGINGLLTGPLSDTTAFRVSSYYHREDGLVINKATGKTVNNSVSYGLRGKFLYEPHDGLTFTLAGDWAYRKADCCGEPLRVAAASGNVTAAFTGAPVGPNSRYVNFDTEQVGWQKNRGASLTVDAKLGDFTLTSITAYRQYRDFAIRDRDGTNAPFTGVTPQQLFSATNPGISAADALAKMKSLLLNNIDFSCRTTNGSLICGESNSLEKSDTFSQELRLASPTGGFADYIVGAFYYNSLTERDLTIGGVRSNIAGNVVFPTATTVTVANPNAYVFADMITKVRNINSAAFANINLHPTSKLTLSAGARFVHDEIKWDHKKVTGPNGDHIGAATSGGANAGTPNWNFYRTFSKDAVLGRATARYEFSRDFMTYASFAKGYKGPGIDADMFVTTAGMAALPAAPETSTSFELGVKSQFFNRRLTVNVTGYKTTFDGYQTSSSGTDGSGAPVLRSAGKLYTKGIEGEVVARPTDQLRLSGNFLFAKNEFGDLFVSPTLNIKGGQPLNAPATKWGATASYDVVVKDWGVNFSTNYTWTAKTLFTNLADANNPNSVWLRPSFGVANATINLTSPNEKYKVNLFVKNLFDKQYVAGLRRISGSVGGAGAVAQALPRDFYRYVGASLTVAF
ncbi:TonB-dependent receptor [Novosphingobium umbonatum]|uniref:TonB-dependent receptor n=1 Tax=Novosphingobium umbonatum TaxID=1908524 RepID=A0A437NCW0_9SPHN|nr:TonB-dependent receptor [Novosphingobium umbonatum]RVU07764.1 TonB-dependent receptor [Novosphingobium umbonatum]